MSCWTMRKKVITMKSYYPEETEHTYFETGEDGMFLLPEKLEAWYLLFQGDRSTLWLSAGRRCGI